jgi:hypothetical protein
VIVLLAVFLAGLVPMWLRSARLEGELEFKQRQLRIDELQIALADAALDARQGHYEPARQRLGKFYAELTEEFSRGIASSLPTDAASRLRPLLDVRDDLITLLARGDPASAERLAGAYASFRETVCR